MRHDHSEIDQIFRRLGSALGFAIGGAICIGFFLLIILLIPDIVYDSPIQKGRSSHLFILGVGLIVGFFFGWAIGWQRQKVKSMKIYKRVYRVQ